MADAAIRLGLIGNNIAASTSPALHRIAGRHCGLFVTYDLLPPPGLGLTFEETLERCRVSGYRGVNVTYPYKQRVADRLVVDDLTVRAIGACNTVVFDGAQARGYNTDYSGFIAAYRATFGDTPPGRVALLGAGGVGRAIAFALAHLGASELRLLDTDRQKAVALAEALRSFHHRTRIELPATIQTAAADADALVNATPVGMIGLGGCPFPRELIRGQRWAFDAVYTPIDTPFMLAARAAGLSPMSGYELFLHQGIDAFRYFTGRAVDADRLRQELRACGASDHA